MARSGPNQDINDSTTIINLAFRYQEESNNRGNILAQLDTGDPSASGAPIVDVTIPFKKTDGSTELLGGNDIELDSGGKFIFDEDLVFNSHIGTYIDLAERFRDYWETLNDVLDQIGGSGVTTQSGIEPEGPTTENPTSGQTIIRGSLSGTAFAQNTFPASLSTPLWSGDGPTNYNQNTYPQLLNELITVSGQIKSWDTIFWFENSTLLDPTFNNIQSRFGKSILGSGVPDNERSVQFFNPGSGIITIELSMHASGTMDSSFQVVISSVADIGEINEYPLPIDFGPTFIIDSEILSNPGGTIILNRIRMVEIPPGKSAFISSRAAVGEIGGSSDIIDANTITILDGQTLTHSFVFP